MKFGIFLNLQHETNEPIVTRFKEYLQQVRVAEENGFDSIWGGQHYLSDYQQINLIPMLSRIAAESEKMTIGTCVILLPLIHPVIVAEELTAIDVMTDGRLIAGFGLGYRDVEFDSLGIRKQDRVSRLCEGVEVIKHLWTSDSVSYEGKHYKLSNVSIRERYTKPPSASV